MFRVGEKVRVKDNANSIAGNVAYTLEMREYLGKEYKVRSIYGDGLYTLEGAVTSTKYYWKFTEKWLEPADSVEINIKEDDFEELLCLK